MQPADEAAQLLQRGGVFEFGFTARTAQRDCEAVFGTACCQTGERRRVAPQHQTGHIGSGRQRQRWHHRHFGGRKFQREGVLFNDLCFAPAAGSIELGDHGRAVFQEDLEHPVFVRIELQYTAVAAQPDRVQRVQHLLRVERGVVQSVSLVDGASVAQ